MLQTRKGTSMTCTASAPRHSGLGSIPIHTNLQPALGDLTYCIAGHTYNAETLLYGSDWYREYTDDWLSTVLATLHQLLVHITQVLLCVTFTLSQKFEDAGSQVIAAAPGHDYLQRWQERWGWEEGGGWGRVCQMAALPCHTVSRSIQEEHM